MSNSPIDVVNKSGFPLQMALASAIQASRPDAIWKVLYTEHAWSHPKSDNSGFIDLVISNSEESCFFVVECKRALETSWAFLCDSAKHLNRRSCKAWITSGGGSGAGYLGWGDIAIDPASPEAEFCVVRGESGKVPMLERVAADLVLATESFAYEQRVFHDDDPGFFGEYFSVVVTTAKLQVVHFDPQQVSLSDGRIPESADVYDVPFVRFRKQLSTRRRLGARGQHSDFRAKDLARAKEHTVLVVHAELLLAFLSEFEIDNSTTRPYLGLA